MIKKLFTNQSKSITGAAILLGAASFLSRVIGIIRDRTFAHLFGAGNTLDAYYAAFRIPDLIYSLVIVGAISAGFIPVFTKLYLKNKEDAWELTNTLINILGISLVCLCGLLFLFTPQVMKLIVPGFSAENLTTTVLLTRIMLINPIILGMSSIVSGAIQSLKAFAIYALAPIMYNLGIIVGATTLVPIFGIRGLGIGVVLGSLLNLGIQLPTLFHHGFRYKPRISLHNPHVRRVAKLMVPRTLAMGVGQLNTIVITAFASTVGVGSVAIFNLANNIEHFPIGIIGISFALAAFPTLAEYIAKNETENFISHLASVIRQIIFFIIPISVIFLLLRAQIVRVTLGSGAFSWDDTTRTANALAFFTLSLFAQSLVPLLVRAFFALHDTWTPLLSAVATACITIIASVFLKDTYGVAGLALAFSIGSIVQLATLWIPLRKKMGTLQELRLLHMLYRIGVASLLMGILVQWIKVPLSHIVDMTRFWGILSQGCIAGILGLLTYGAICYMLRVEEMRQFFSSLQKKWLKLRNIQGDIPHTDERIV